MIVRIVKKSLVNLNVFSGIALTNVSEYVGVIEASPNLQKLHSVLPDDVEVSGSEFTIVIKDNYQNAVGCIKGIVDNNNEVTINFQAYE